MRDDRDHGGGPTAASRPPPGLTRGVREVRVSVSRTGGQSATIEWPDPAISGDGGAGRVLLPRLEPRAGRHQHLQHQRPGELHRPSRAVPRHLRSQRLAKPSPRSGHGQTPGARQAPSPVLEQGPVHDSTSPASTGSRFRPARRRSRCSWRCARLWADHVIWTREYVVAAIANSPDAQAVAGGLLANQEHIGSAIVPFYGEQAGQALTGLLKQHIMVAVKAPSRPPRRATRTSSPTPGSAGIRTPATSRRS